MAYRDRSSNQSNYGETQRFNQPLSSLFDMNHSSRHDLQGESYLSRGSNTSIYERGSHSHSFNESYPNQQSSKFNPYAGSSPAWGEISRGNSGEFAAKSGYHSQQNISDLFDFPSANKHNQFGSPRERNYQQSFQERVDPSYERDYEKPEMESYQRSYQERVNPPFERDYEKTERDSYQQSYQERGNPPFHRDYEQPERDSYHTDRFEHTTSDPNNYNDDNFQRKSYSSDQVSFEPTSEGSNRNFGNQRSVFRGNSYRGEFQSRRQRGRGKLAGKTHLVEGDLQSRNYFESRNNQPGPQSNHSFSSTDAKGQVTPYLNQDEDDEFDSDNEGEQTTKTNLITIDKALYEKYKFYPPTAEEMGNIFHGMVIFFFHKYMKTIAEPNTFRVICESFGQSSQFDRLSTADGFEKGNKHRKFCTLRYNNMIMARGVSENSNIKEARIWAAVELINKLAMTCYTLKVKKPYFKGTNIQYMLKTRECPGVFRVVPEEAVPTVESGLRYIEDFFNREDSDCELVFTNNKMLQPIKGFIKQNRHLDGRIFGTHVAVYRRRTPQYWRDKILASGQMENEKYTLIPPQGLGKELLENFDIKTVVNRLRAFPTLNASSDEKAKFYGPQAEKKIQCAVPPWAKPAVRNNRGLSKKKQQTVAQIEQALKAGQSHLSVKGYKHLSKNTKKWVRSKYGLQ